MAVGCLASQKQGSAAALARRSRGPANAAPVAARGSLPGSRETCRSLGANVAAGQAGPPAALLPTTGQLDHTALLADLLLRGKLSDRPQAPTWGHVQPGRSDLDAVGGWLAAALPRAEVRAVYRVQCAAATRAAYVGVQKALGPERLLWHGTPWDAVANIAQHGFNRAYCGRHGAKLGRGSYFAEEAAYAARFCGKSTASRAIFLAGVLPGRYCRGEDGLVEPPADDSGARFDATVDDTERPKVFCVFRDFQALPLYLVEAVW